MWKLVPLFLLKQALQRDPLLTKSWACVPYLFQQELDDLGMSHGGGVVEG